jgi:uncharacterized membrane protein YkgB
MIQQDIPPRLDLFDQRLSAFMERWGYPALRISLAIIFIWFGILKPLGISPAAELVKATVAWMPLLDPGQWLVVIGWWEVAIGVTILHPSTARIAILLLAFQMGGTFLPLLIVPQVTFQPGHFPYGPTVEGQYIIKNLVVISAALVIGGRVRTAADSPRTMGNEPRPEHQAHRASDIKKCDRIF